ncbi:hypothetical protein EJ03DRAFT_331977, partial [Teratosphaeria nubilosa]
MAQLVPESLFQLILACNAYAITSERKVASKLVRRSAAWVLVAGVCGRVNRREESVPMLERRERKAGVVLRASSCGTSFRLGPVSRL